MAAGVWALIPVYQGASTVGAVVRGVIASGLPVIAVDDGSTDGSADAAAAAGAMVIRHAANRGKGAALQSGFALAERRGAQAVLTLDADGQHDPSEIPNMIAQHSSHPEALIIGVRDFAAMPRRSLIGNRISTWWISRFSGILFHDSQSGFRVYPRAIFAGAALRRTRFDTETELLLWAAKRDVQIVEIPIHTIYPSDGTHHVSNFHGLYDTLRILSLVIGSLAWKADRTSSK